MTEPMTPEQVVAEVWGVYHGRGAMTPQLARRVEAAINAQTAEVDRLLKVADKWSQRAIEAEAEVSEREVQITRLDAEVDRLQAGADSLLQDRNDAVRVLMALFPDRATDGTAHHMALVTRAEVDRLRARDTVVQAFISQRAEFVQALTASVDADADYWRWQGHAEGRRHLLERLAALASGDEVQS